MGASHIFSMVEKTCATWRGARCPGYVVDHLVPLKSGGGLHRADDLALRCRGGHGPLLGGAEKRWKRPVRGFWYKNQGHGLGDGPEGLQHALSTSRNPARDQSMIPFSRR